MFSCFGSHVQTIVAKLGSLLHRLFSRIPQIHDLPKSMKTWRNKKEHFVVSLAQLEKAWHQFPTGRCPMVPKVEGPLCLGILGASRRASIKQSMNFVPNLSWETTRGSVRTLPLKASKKSSVVCVGEDKSNSNSPWKTIPSITGFSRSYWEQYCNPHNQHRLFGERPRFLKGCLTLSIMGGQRKNLDSYIDVDVTGRI